MDSPTAAAPSTPAADQGPRPGVYGSALWIAVGVLVGASIAGIGLSYFRTPALSPVHHASSSPTAGNLGDAGSAGNVGGSGSSARNLVAVRIDLNRASQTELEMLPGVGPTMAQRIIEYRERRGGFRSIEELDQVKGVGPRMIEKLRPLVRITR